MELTRKLWILELLLKTQVEPGLRTSGLRLHRRRLSVEAIARKRAGAITKSAASPVVKG